MITVTITVNAQNDNDIISPTWHHNAHAVFVVRWLHCCSCLFVCLFLFDRRCSPAGTGTRGTTTKTSGTATAVTPGTAATATRGTGGRAACPERGSSTWPTGMSTTESESIHLFVNMFVFLSCYTSVCYLSSRMNIKYHCSRTCGCQHVCILYFVVHIIFRVIIRTYENIIPLLSYLVSHACIYVRSISRHPC